MSCDECHAMSVMRTTVEGSLSPHGQQYAIRSFPFDYLLHILGIDRQEVHHVCLLFPLRVRLHGGDVWVHEDGLDVFLLQARGTTMLTKQIPNHSICTFPPADLFMQTPFKYAAISARKLYILVIPSLESHHCL